MPGLSQDAVPHRMGDNVDLYLRTPENFVEAMGGLLDIYAVFAGGKVKLTPTTEDSVSANPGAKQSKEPEQEEHPASKRENAGKYRRTGIAKNRRGPKRRGKPSASARPAV